MNPLGIHPGESTLFADKQRLLEVSEAWKVYGSYLSSLISAAPAKHVAENKEFVKCVALLCDQGLRSLLIDCFLNSLERSFKEHYVSSFWKRFDEFSRLQEQVKEKDKQARTGKLFDWIQCTLPKALEEICTAKLMQQEYLALLVHAIRISDGTTSTLGGRESKQFNARAGNSADLSLKYDTTITALILTSAPKHFFEILDIYFKARLEEFSKVAKSFTFGTEEGSDTDQDGDGHQAGEGDSSENDEMESTPGSRRTSGFVEDMEMNGNGSPVSSLDLKRGDSAGVHAMEGIVCSSVGDIKVAAHGALQDVAELAGPAWAAEVGNVVRNLTELGFAAIGEEAYASAIYSLLKTKIHSVATKRYEKPVLAPIRQWIKVVPLCFLRAILAWGNPSSQGKTDFTPLPSPLASSPSATLGGSDDASERVVRWHLRLEFFAYETLGDLRISELFDIIVDYPESLAAIEDLRQCLANTGQHAKLVDSFRTALRHRLLTAGAATTDILLQYVSTIKALRTMDPSGVFLEAVGEPIREYLRGRKDTIRCIVTMLTEDAGAGSSASLGGIGESLLEELSRGTTALENADSEDEGVVDDDEAWAAAERWEPDPVEADPSRTSKSRRSMDIIGMLVGIYGSKELFVNEYRMMLAEKLLNKSDYDIDRDIRTLELLKLRFGESSMHGCEIMLKDIADSKRINSNIKASVSATAVQTSSVRAQSPAPFTGLAPPVAPNISIASRSTDHGSRLAAFVARARGVFSQTGQEADSSNDQSVERGGKGLCLETLDATIISSLFWPPFQAETIKVPEEVDRLFDDYAQRYHALKAPRKLQWKKQLGIVKLELQFEDRSAQFMVSPMHASIIMQFEGCPSWAATELAAAVGVPAPTLRRRIMLWVNQGVVMESNGAKEGELYYTIVENMGDMGNRNASITVGDIDSAVPLLGEEEGESAVASMEDQWQQEMNVYESYIVGMLTNFDSLPLDRIHNMLKMFVSDPPYDKTLQQLQAFLSRLVSEEKLEIRDGLYRRRQQ